MSTRALERFEEWDSEAFPGGYRALHDLAAEDFSGIVTGGGAKLCMLNGTVVGILDGTVEDFETHEGTVYDAPSPALPLLALMQERNDEVKAKYYTEDNPISEVDETLTDGKFSGYIELSENVLSGDYYLVYHAGRSMAVAFVGNSKQLLTDDEAFERADGEVGIYQVRPAEVEPIDIPDPDPDPDPDPEPADGAPAAATDDAPTAEGTGDGTETAADADATAPSEETDAPPADSGDTRADEPETVAPADDDAEAASGVDDDGAADDGTAAADDGRVPDDGTATADDGRVADDGTATADDGPSTADRSGGTGSGPGASAGTARDPVGDPGADDATARTSSPSRPEGGRPEPEQDAPRRGSDRPESPDSGRPGPVGDRSDVAAGPTRGTDRLETYSIPSLDPSRSASRREERTAVASMGPRTEGDRTSGGADPGSDPGSGTAGNEAPETDARGSPGDAETRNHGQNPGTGARAGPEEAPPGPGSGPGAGRAGTEPDARGGDAGADARITELEADLSETTEELDRVEAQLEEVRDERDDLRRERDDLVDERDALETELDDLRRERDDLADERDALEAEVTDLEAEIERLNSQLDGMEERFGASPDAEQRLTPAEALDQTDIFVRYESKGQATLETAHQGNASRQQVNENLGLEYHTQFDAANTAVAGKSFDAFLGETIQFRFIRWVIEDLLYEVQDTGKVAALQDLYDAIPRIDRAELNGTVNAEFTEDGGDRRTQESFDVVLRDRMGNPLFVANMNDSRQAATESMMTSLVTASSHVGETTETLGASFLVTSSFFEPEALETAAEATSGGLLSRDKRESFVKLSRKRGYHLCLVEAREGKFHLAVPEL